MIPERSIFDIRGLRELQAELQLSDDDLHQLFENNEELQSRVVAIIRELSTRSQFADEEIGSQYTYPPGYKVKKLAEQVAILRDLFPQLEKATFDQSLVTRWLGCGEGWFAIPRWEAVGSTYGVAVDQVLATLAFTRRFDDWAGPKLASYYLRQHPKTVKAFQKLCEEQAGHDILVVSAQFGLRHRGCSARRARKVMNALEFGLGVFAVGCMMLTHPEREVQAEQLHVTCPGDGFWSDARWDVDTPSFITLGNTVIFKPEPFNRVVKSFGAASGFLLK